MRLLELPIREYEPGETVRVVPITDVHQGSRAFDEEAFCRTVDYCVSHDDVLVILGGDLIDGINPSDRRFAMTCLAEKYQNEVSFHDLCLRQARDVVKTLKPLANTGRVIGAFMGNHEETVIQRYYFDVHNYICEELGVTDMTYMGMFRHRFVQKGKRKQTVVVGFYTHGFMTSGNIDLFVKKTHQFDADYYAHGHNHQRKTHNEPTWSIRNGIPGDGGKQMRNRAYAFTSTYMKQYPVGPSQYPERRGYPLTDIGPVQFAINPETGEVRATELDI